MRNTSVGADYADGGFNADNNQGGASAPTARPRHSRPYKTVTIYW